VPWIISLNEDFIISWLQVTSETEIAIAGLEFGVEILIIISTKFSRDDYSEITILP
jgi:hypothetical protein